MVYQRTRNEILLPCFKLALDISTCIQDLLCVYHIHATSNRNNTKISVSRKWL